MFGQDLGVMGKRKCCEWNFFKWEKQLNCQFFQHPEYSHFLILLYCSSIRETGHMERNYTSSGGTKCDLVLEGETCLQK